MVQSRRLLVAGVGFEPHDLRVIALRRFVVTRKNYRTCAFPLFFRPLHEFLLAVSSTRRARKNSPTSNARRAHNQSANLIPPHSKKKNTHRLMSVFFLVAGVGFEPHDLRVMSPTSYQAAPSRDICDACI